MTKARIDTGDQYLQAHLLITMTSKVNSKEYEFKNEMREIDIFYQ